MKHACLVSALFCLIFTSCGEDGTNNIPGSNGEKGTENNPLSQHPIKRRTVDFDSNISEMRSTRSGAQKADAIRRVARVDEKDYPKAIPFLIDIMKNSKVLYERTAAANALINIGTKEALRPVQEALVFRTDPRFSLCIQKILEKKYPNSHTDVMLSWTEELLKNRNILSERSSRDIITALFFVRRVKGGKKIYIDPSIYMQDKDMRITLNMYSITALYPRKKVPVRLVESRLNTKLKSKSLSAEELKAALDMFSTAEIPLSRVNISLDTETVLWALDHESHEMRQAMLDCVKTKWNRFSASDREAIRKKVEQVAENDPMKQDTTYPVREKAESVLQSIR